ncbi:tail fiber domain-containing protein [Filomicrobium sp.]|uniref:tail fiber domain-containing protein n=1 Tax=Filomicrobium sp. TaxID=2024831 RepID=UPI00258AE910|nr:tail fiber domain-containing protein [Filomicrobium sp.]MCV0371875.1 tail fiber domain-containing protein [Filomicrobium sp.]
MDASLQARTSTETRPKNVAVIYCQYNGYNTELSTGVATLASLSDVAVGGVATGQVLAFDGSSWVPSNTSSVGLLNDLTDVNTAGAVAGNVIRYNGSSWVVSDATSVAALSSLSDVTLTNLAGRDYLRYDAIASKWVNISESTVMSTTTILPGWPDAMICNKDGDDYVLYNKYNDATTVYYGLWTNNSASEWRVSVSKATRTVANANNLGTADCVGQSIAQMYAAGKAFNFIGGIEGDAGSPVEGDRITSGTLAVIGNSATSIVSLSTNGTTWGYLGNAASYLPTLTANKVSSTNISSTYIQLSSATTLIACNSSNAGAIRYSSSTLQYCDGSNWTAEDSGSRIFTYCTNENSDGDGNDDKVACVGAAADTGRGDGTYRPINCISSNGGAEGTRPGGAMRWLGTKWEFYISSWADCADGSMVVANFSAISGGGEGSGSSAEGDRLVSGTLAVIGNSATSIVSLSTNGTTWGYLGNAASYLPTLTANKVSSTNISATYVHLNSATTPLTCNSGFTGAMRYTSGTMQVCDGNNWGNIGIGVPGGTIAAFEAVSCPAGWSEYTPARGRFLRGIDTLAAGIDPSGTRAPGNIQEDTLQNVTGFFGGTNLSTEGPFYVDGGSGNFGSSGTGARRNVAFDLSLSARTSTETRPKNVAVIYCQYNGLESQLSTGVATLASLSDVAVGGVATGQVLAFDGSSWVPSNTSSVGLLNDLTDVNTAGAVAGNVIRYNGSSWVVSDATSVAALSSLTDVTLTNLAGRDYLRYDAGASKWVNISESTVMSTTTMIDGWPDAIVCNVTNPVWGLSVGYLTRAPGNANLYGYAFNSMSTNNLFHAYFNPDGSFNSYQNLTTTDCNTSISSLYATGQAFNFIGSANVAGSSAEGDRLTSGTLSVVANSTTSVVSLSTAGTTWGYLGNGVSYLPTLMSGKVSSTNISSTYVQLSSATTPQACSNSIVGAIRYSVGTIQVCNGVAWTSQTTGDNSDLFAVLADQKPTGTHGGTYPANTWVTRDLNTKLYDSIGVTLSSNQFTLPAGTYLIDAVIHAYKTGASQALLYNVTDAAAALNGTTVLASPSNNVYLTAGLRGVLVLDSAKTFEIRWRGDNGQSGTGLGFAANIAGYPETYMNVLITKLNSGGGGDGGNGVSAFNDLTDVNTAGAVEGNVIRYDGSNWVVSDATSVMALSGLTDVTLTNLAGRDYLRYDAGASKWVNISESTVMSTTTMVNGWPDAIVCNSGANRRVLFYDIADSNYVNYHMAQSGAGGYISMIFNKSTRAYYSHAGMTGFDCLNQSIQQLYSEGKAFNFIGSANVAGSSAEGDRLTSGTLSVVANSTTSVVSLSTAGTTWGYLGNGVSYLPTLMSGKVSSTNISSTYVQLSSATTPQACSNSIVGAIRYSVGTIQVCNGVAWTSQTTGDNSDLFAVLADQKPTGTHGGSYTANTWVVRDLNTKLYDSIGVTVSSNQFTLPAGTYLIDVGVSAYKTGASLSLLYNVTDAAVALNGTATLASNSSNGYANSVIRGVLVLDSAKTFEIHWRGGNSQATTALGYAADIAGYPETYMNVLVTKLNSGGGGDGGNGVSAFNDLTDVNTAGAVAGSYIRYDGSTWVVSTTYDIATPDADRITSGTLAMVANTSGNYVSLTTGGTTWGYFGQSASYLPTLLTVGGNVSVTGGISVTGSVQAYSYLHLSDERLKDTITTIPNAADILTKLRGTHFRWKSSKQFSYGLIAQEVEKVVPDLVTNGEGLKAVDYDQLAPILLEGWKVHHKAIKALEDENAQLKAAMEGLEQRIRKLEAAGVAR